jgi:CRP-like cAMP-binding protein
MYIIVEGQAQILKGPEGSEKTLAVRGAGDFVGEMAIIESGPRVATVRAQGDVRALVIDGDAFNAILRDRQNVAISVMRTLSRRLREMMK